MSHTRVGLSAALSVVLCAGLSQGLAQQAAEKPEATGKQDTRTGVIVSDAVTPVAKATTCTLIVPASVTNGQSFSFQVNYSPCVTGGRVETFTFAWPTTLPSFAERTTRDKLFFSNASCVSGSFESTVAPGALAIKGTANVRVDVHGENFDCTATKTMTVN